MQAMQPSCGLHVRAPHTSHRVPYTVHPDGQVSVEAATSIDPAYPFIAGPTAQGLSWYITFPPASGDVPSLIVSTGNGAESIPGSMLASAGTLTGTDPFVTVKEFRKGGVLTSMVTPEEGLEHGVAYAVRVRAYNGIAWSEVGRTCGLLQVRKAGKGWGAVPPCRYGALLYSTKHDPMTARETTSRTKQLCAHLCIWSQSRQSNIL